MIFRCSTKCGSNENHLAYVLYFVVFYDKIEAYHKAIFALVIEIKFVLRVSFKSVILTRLFRSIFPLFVKLIRCFA